MLDYLGFALAFIGGASGVALWLYGTGRLAGATTATTNAKLEAQERRMDEGGRRLSDLTSKLQLLPATISQLQDELTRLRTDISNLETHQADLRVSVARLEERQRFGA